MSGPTLIFGVLRHSDFDVGSLSLAAAKLLTTLASWLPVDASHDWRFHFSPDWARGIEHDLSPAGFCIFLCDELINADDLANGIYSEVNGGVLGERSRSSLGFGFSASQDVPLAVSGRLGVKLAVHLSFSCLESASVPSTFAVSIRDSVGIRSSGRGAFTFLESVDWTGLFRSLSDAVDVRHIALRGLGEFAEFRDALCGDGRDSLLEVGRVTYIGDVELPPGSGFCVEAARNGIIVRCESEQGVREARDAIRAHLLRPDGQGYCVLPQDAARDADFARRFNLARGLGNLSVPGLAITGYEPESKSLLWATLLEGVPPNFRTGGSLDSRPATHLELSEISVLVEATRQLAYAKREGHPLPIQWWIEGVEHRAESVRVMLKRFLEVGEDQILVRSAGRDRVEQ